MTRKGNITDGIRAETGLEYQLILAVQRLEDVYAEREAAMGFPISFAKFRGLSKIDSLQADMVSHLISPATD